MILFIFLIVFLVIWGIVGFTFYIEDDGHDYLMLIKHPLKKVIFLFVCGPLVWIMEILVIIFEKIIFKIINKIEKPIPKISKWFQS